MLRVTEQVILNVLLAPKISITSYKTCNKFQTTAKILFWVHVSAKLAKPLEPNASPALAHAPHVTLVASAILVHVLALL